MIRIVALRLLSYVQLNYCPLTLSWNPQNTLYSIIIIYSTKHLICWWVMNKHGQLLTAYITHKRRQLGVKGVDYVEALKVLLLVAGRGDNEVALKLLPHCHVLWLVLRSLALNKDILRSRSSGPFTLAHWRGHVKGFKKRGKLLLNKMYSVHVQTEPKVF